jgi:hypothetical protein
VAQVALDLDFPADLLLDARLLQLGFVEDFERADEVVLSLASEVHASEFALAEGLADFE